MSLLLYGLSALKRAQRANAIAANNLDLFIARVEADGGVVLLTTDLCQNYGMSATYAVYYILLKRVTADGGVILNPNIWNV